MGDEMVWGKVLKARRERDELLAERDRLRAELAAIEEIVGGDVLLSKSLVALVAERVAERDRLRAERDAVQAEAAGLREALDKACEGAARQLAEPRNYDNDQYALTAIATTCELALARMPEQHRGRIVEEAIEKYIDDHGIKCDCCQHIMIDVTAAKEGGNQSVHG